MKQQWIAVADVLPKTVAESDVQIHVQQLTAAGLPAKYLDTVHYPRLVLYSTTPPPVPTPTPEGSWVVFVGPFPSQPDADVAVPADRREPGQRDLLHRPARPALITALDESLGVRADGHLGQADQRLQRRVLRG